MEINTYYNDWEVLDKDFIIKNHKRHLKCRCKCGKIREINFSQLRLGKSKRCSSCAGKLVELPKGFTDRWKGSVIKGLNRTMYSHIKEKARERDLEFSVSQEFLADLLEKQNYKCALSNLDITLSLETKNGNPNFSFITASLDRIDSSKGYTEDNVQWLHKDINKMKMAYPNSYFIEICKLIANHKN